MARPDENNSNQNLAFARNPEGISKADFVIVIVAGMGEQTTELIAELYGKVIPHIFKAKDIKTADGAKVIKNVQRDLNVALMNELSLIFDGMGLNTRDVLNAAALRDNEGA